MICPLCGQGTVREVRLIALDRTGFLCDECDAFWEHRSAISAHQYADYGTWMEARGRPGIWSEVEVLEDEPWPGLPRTHRDPPLAERIHMKHVDALALLGAAVHAAEGEVWADLGAGTGVFTRALAALVGPAGRVVAVDRDSRALGAIGERAATGSAGAIELVRGDVTRPLALPPLDGVVMANVLHFVPDADSVLSRVAALLEPGGRLVLIEYEGRRPSRWVPYPVDSARFVELAAGAGFTPPRVVARRPSLFGGDIYAAVAERAR